MIVQIHTRTTTDNTENTSRQKNRSTETNKNHYIEKQNNYVMCAKHTHKQHCRKRALALNWCSPLILQYCQRRYGSCHCG